MKTYPYNYLGICISNKDPEYRGRVKIFIPHIMPALYENWNKENKDITIECVGDNLANGLPSAIIEKLEKILPWAECASPLIGASVAGSYSSSSGQFNQNTNGPDPSQNSGTPNYTGLNLNPGVFSGFGDELQNPAVREKLFTLMKAEVGSQGPQAQQAFLETVRNRAIVQNTSINNIISNTAYYQPYKDGAFNRAANNLTNTERTNYNGLLQTVLNGSNITNGATHNASAGVAASVRNGGYDSVRGSIVEVGGETYYSKTYEQKGLRSLFENINNVVDVNDPTSPPETSAVGTVTVPFNTPDGNTTYTDPEGEDMQPSVATQGEPIPATGSGNGNLQKGLADARRQVGNIYGTSFGGKCHKATRGLVSAALGVPGHFGAGVASAKLAIGTNYWTNGGYYEVLHPSGTNKTGYQPQEGDIAVTTGGEHGHAKAVVNGQFRSDNLNDSSANVLKESTEIYRLTKEGRDAWEAAGVGDASLIGQALADNPVNNEGLDGLSSGSDDPGRTRMVQHTTNTQASPIDSTGMPQGLFSYPNPGALLWIFFREGNPLFPVYFAASYGRNEWQSAHQAASQPLYYPADGDDTNRVVNKSIMRFNGGGMIESNGTVTADKDYRSLTLAHANGAHLQFHPTGSIQYSPNEHLEQVAGTKYSYRLNNESWTQGVDNKVVLGNQYIKVGNPSQDNVEIIEQLQAKIKELNDIMLED